MFNTSKYDHTLPILVDELHHENDAFRSKSFTVDIVQPVKSIEDGPSHVIVTESLFINIYNNTCKFALLKIKIYNFFILNIALIGITEREDANNLKVPSIDTDVTCNTIMTIGLITATIVLSIIGKINNNNIHCFAFSFRSIPFFFFAGFVIHICVCFCFLHKSKTLASQNKSHA